MTRRQTKIEAKLAREPHGRARRRLEWRRVGGNRPIWKGHLNGGRVISREQDESERKDQNRLNRALRQTRVLNLTKSIVSRITSAFVHRHQAR